MGSDCRLVSAVIADTKIVSQFHSCFFAGQTAQTGNEVNYISVSLASKAMKTLIDFHAWVLIIVKWADCHAVAVDLDAVHLSRLSGAYIGFYCFKYIQIITSSLKGKCRVRVPYSVFSVCAAEISAPAVSSALADTSSFL